MKYLVMECHLSHAVVLGDDGRFLKVANMRYEVGQTVEQVIEMQVPDVPAKTKSPVRWLTPLAAMAACLALALTMLFFRAPCASVYLTINPEVRVDVNRADMVVGVEGVNADGVVLLEGYDCRRKSLDTVMDELVDRAIELGYLSDGGTVTLTLDADDAWVVSHSEALGTHLSDHLTPVISVTVEITAAREAVIPVDPDYSDTDYGTEPPTQVPTQAAADTDYGPGSDGVTDHDDHDDGVTDYDAPEDGDDVTDNSGGSRYHEDDHGDSCYESDDDD